jgi:hypothetical protein
MVRKRVKTDAFLDSLFLSHGVVSKGIYGILKALKSHKVHENASKKVLFSKISLGLDPPLAPAVLG